MPGPGYRAPSRKEMFQRYLKEKTHPKAGKRGGVTRRGVYVHGERTKKLGPYWGKPRGRDDRMGLRGYTKPGRGRRA